VVVFKWKQRQAGHIAYWQQERPFERRQGEAASRLPDSLERPQKMDHAKARIKRLDGELQSCSETLSVYIIRPTA
jgi:hypothetical protein